MKIQIIKGVYGHSENGVIVPKSKNSEPFEIKDEKAKELISKGVAIKASELKSEADRPIRYRESLAPKNELIDKTVKKDEPQNQLNDNDSKSEDANNTEENIPKYSMQNNKDQLIKIATDLGLEIGDPDNITKQEIIDLIDEAVAGDAPQIGNDEGIVE